MKQNHPQTVVIIIVHKTQKIKSCSSHDAAIVVPVEPMLKFLPESFQTLPSALSSATGISSVTVLKVSLH